MPPYLSVVGVDRCWRSRSSCNGNRKTDSKETSTISNRNNETHPPIPLQVGGAAPEIRKAETETADQWAVRTLHKTEEENSKGEESALGGSQVTRRELTVEREEREDYGGKETIEELAGPTEQEDESSESAEVWTEDWWCPQEDAEVPP